MDPQRQIAAPGAFTAAGLQSSRRPRLWPASWRRVATPWLTGRVTRPAFWGRADDSETVPARYANSARDHGLDGLRGIAIVLVLVGHTNLAFPFAATVGVTLFFVLSGYLITRILLERPPLRTFYWRRLARLAPALVSVVVVVAVASALRGDATTLVGALVSLAYVSNWLPSMGVDVGSMGHTWSLAVEEQFYVLWPLALFAIPRIRPVLVGLIVTIMVIRVVSGQHDPTEYRTTLRADALLLGCLLAMVTWRPSGALAFAAAAIVETLAVTRFEAGGLGLGLATLASVVLVAWVRGKSSPRWLSGLGRISYGVYLWHLPLYLWFGPVVGIPLALLVAAVSFRWFEEPVRRRLTGDRHKGDARILDAFRLPSGLDQREDRAGLGGEAQPIGAARLAQS